MWSPHMPLSVDEYAELEDAAAALKLSLLAVLDPGAEPGFARRVARERGLPESALARLGAIELAFRGGSLDPHAPVTRGPHRETFLVKSRIGAPDTDRQSTRSACTGLSRAARRAGR